MKTSGDGSAPLPLWSCHLVGLRHSELGEGVEDEASDCGLRFLPFDGSCGQVWSKDGFESEHGGFGEASSVVVALDFPLLSSHLPDALEIAVSEQERIVGGRVSAWFGVPARRDVDLDGSALFEGPFAEQCVDLPFVIGPVAAESVEGEARSAIWPAL